MQGHMTRPWQTSRSGETALSWQWLVKAAVVGLVAGMMMGVFSMIVAVIAGDGFWAPMRGITAMFFGKEHLGGSWDLPTVIVGAGLHMAFAMMLGVMYAVLLGIGMNRLSAAVQLMAGMVFGLAVWAINTFAIGPVLPGDELMTSAMPVWAWLVGHLIYGGMLGLLYAWWRGGTTAFTADSPAIRSPSAA